MPILNKGYRPKSYQTKNCNALHRRARTAPWSKRLWASLLPLLLCGCVSVPTPPTEPLGFVVPTSWSGAATQVILPVSDKDTLADWWLRFEDPLLSQLIHQALAANTSVRGAQAALLEARALRDVGRAALWPALDSSLSVGRSRSANVTSNNFQVGLDASWELDVFGANRSAVNALDATALASAASLGQVQVSIAAEVALDYMALRSAQERLTIAQGNLSSQQETLQITQWREQAGLVTSLESEQATTLTEQTAAAVPSLQITIDQSRHALAVLTGQPPDALATVLAATGTLPQAPDGLALAFPADTLRQRSDVRVVEFQVNAAAARVSQADAARLPSFALGGSLGLSALTVGALTDGASVAAAVLASMTWPVFDGGASRAQLRAQQAALAQANTSYQAAVLTALTEVEDALVALQGDQQRLLRLQNAFAAADSAATLASQRYSSGLVDFSTVLETQRTRLNTQDSVAVARATVSADHVRLYKALGGGWQPDSLEPTAAPASQPIQIPKS